MFATNRKISYKLPPTTIRDKLVSQEARRTKALEEQKRRRAQRVDSSRQLDFFADLSLAEHSDEDIHEPEAIEGDEVSADPRLAAASVAAYASLLQAGDANNTIEMLPPSEVPQISAPASANPLEASISTDPSEEPLAPDPSESKKSRRRGGKNSHKRRAEANKASNSHTYKAGSSQWADKCMYAELLEMNGDEVWNANGYEDQGNHDGLPSDLEHGWVAVAPVPKGKRCLVVTHQSAGVAGVVPNTTLRSRLLGKSLLSRFPSPLPPLTVLDCILDNQWRENGILHVLDVVRWKGQDIADCEAGFRFWWRDTRLAELTQSPPPTFHFVAPSSTADPSNPLAPTRSGNGSQSRYYFPYPTTFIPVPYYSSTTLAALDTQIIPAARSVRMVPITLPASINPFANNAVASTSTENGGMEIEPSPQADALGIVAPMPATAIVQPDGLLLYVAEASYEPGTSPLSSWIPIQGYDDHAHEDATEIQGVQQKNPLDLFHKLVRKRIARTPNVMSGSGYADIDSPADVNRPCETGAGDVIMEL